MMDRHGKVMLLLDAAAADLEALSLAGLVSLVECFHLPFVSDCSR